MTSTRPARRHTPMTDAADDTTSLHTQLAAHRRTLAVYLRQLASLGAAYAPPGVHTGIAETRAAIARLKAALRAAGGAVEDEIGDVATPEEVAARPAPSRGFADQPLDPATSMGSLAVLLKDHGDYAALYERALAIREQVLGPAHLDTAQSLNNLAALLDEGRVYGGGLHKLEPNELANVRADGIQELLSTDAPELLLQHTLYVQKISLAAFV